MARHRRRALSGHGHRPDGARAPAGVAWPDGQPVVRLPSGQEVDVLEEGGAWAETGSPELSQAYAEVSED